MTRAQIAEARAFDSWLDYQDALKRALAPLTPEQLRERPIPGLRTPGELSEHIVFGRALHLTRTLGDRAAALAPFLTWDDDEDPPRSAPEIVDGLERTWDAIAGLLMSGSPHDSVAEDSGPSPTQIVWGLLDHDLPHAGELSYLLRAMGLDGVEI